jgi:hypothetical protein
VAIRGKNFFRPSFDAYHLKFRLSLPDPHPIGPGDQIA